jgi:uncharacterized protein YceK
MIGPVTRLVALLVVPLVLLAGCSSTPPEVVFTAGAASATAGPTQYCDDENVNCQNFPEAPVDLPVPPGTPLEVAVPPEIAGTPWQIVFSYRTAAGEPVDERTAVQVDRDSYVLQLAPDARLLIAEVQQFGPAPEVDPQTGELQFPIRASWVLTATA